LQLDNTCMACAKAAPAEFHELGRIRLPEVPISGGAQTETNASPAVYASVTAALPAAPACTRLDGDDRSRHYRQARQLDAHRAIPERRALSCLVSETGTLKSKKPAQSIERASAE
jgi:hypothetical protein